MNTDAVDGRPTAWPGPVSGEHARDGPAAMRDCHRWCRTRRTTGSGWPYSEQEGVGLRGPARLGNFMPVSRSVVDSLADRLNDLLDRLLGPFAAPAKPALAPVPVRTRPPYAGRRAVRR